MVSMIGILPEISPEILGVAASVGTRTFRICHKIWVLLHDSGSGFSFFFDWELSVEFVLPSASKDNWQSKLGCQYESK